MRPVLTWRLEEILRRIFGGSERKPVELLEISLEKQKRGEQKLGIRAGASITGMGGGRLDSRDKPLLCFVLRVMERDTKMPRAVKGDRT